MRFRHDDSDFVRAARQQDFLRPGQGPVRRSATILGDRKELVRDLLALHAHRHPHQRGDPAAAQARVPVLEEPDPGGPLPRRAGRRGRLRRRSRPQRLAAMREAFLNAKRDEGPARDRALGHEHGQAQEAQAQEEGARRSRPDLPPGVIDGQAGGRGRRRPGREELRLPVYYPAVAPRARRLRLRRARLPGGARLQDPRPRQEALRRLPAGRSTRARPASTTACRARAGSRRRSSTARARHDQDARPQVRALLRRRPPAARRLAHAARRRTGSRTRCRRS